MNKCPDSIHKTLSYCQWPSCERFMLSFAEARPFRGVSGEKKLTLIWQILCPAQM